MGAVIQQGDVELRRIASIPEGAQLVAPGARGHVLAEGEVTGHAHTIAASKAHAFALDGRMFVEVTDATELQHQEHAAAPLPVGAYEVGIVREFDPFAQAARAVMD